MGQPAAIGVDIGGTHVRAARVSAAGDVLAWAARPTARGAARWWRPRSASSCDRSRADVAAIGIGVPGRVDAGQGRALSGGYVDLAGLPLAEAIARRSSGGRSSSTMTAAWRCSPNTRIGAARVGKHAVMFTIGTGIGGAVIADGALLRGRASAGQLGHITVDGGGKSCLCGRHGCVETTSSGTALRRHIADADLAAATSAETLLSRSADGDAAAKAVLAAWAAPMRIAIDTVRRDLRSGAGCARRRPWRRHAPGARLLSRRGRVVPVRGRAREPRRSRRCHRRRLERARQTEGSVVMKRAVLVNGVPASGKSTVARAVSQSKGWPLLTLDTVKEAFFEHLGTGDRDYSRLLGRASYQAIFALIADFPDGATAVVDAWFGFQPVELLRGHLARAGIGQVAEIWCHAPAEIIGERYRARLEDAPFRPSRQILCPGADGAGRPRPAARRLSAIRRGHHAAS